MTRCERHWSRSPTLRLTGMAAVLLQLVLATVGATDPLPAIAGIQAYLFSSRTGALSGDVLAGGGPELGNVPSGALASVSTLVVVRVRVGPDTPDRLRVRLVAVESGATPFAVSRPRTRDRVILDRTAPLGPIDPDGITHVGFWLQQTGCRTISLKASLLGARTTAPPVAEVLPFTCYE